MSETPSLYVRVRQMAELLRAEIKEGRWQPGCVLTQPALARRYGAPVHIVTAAIGLLREEGLVESRSRIGTRPKAAGETWDAPDGVPQILHIECTVRAHR
ncbi:GntR family transcriptional regulator [Streptomyces poonensis]|uniref:HTH gntR-type domain-containing protein n=1 Tax=Streptomyces poonensis TaxID=68255 RepID=A0A918PGE4_9ACTN|nr:GntR family transcriptional regulator [Streptomyces poonensis]GGZ05787.1 hypothetical protein GCM10010365_26310 [Streptomyces poonensis]GLJ92595.1 hypothetical protein GCM10017589_52050 [Streptomyces poonensis]